MLLLNSSPYIPTPILSMPITARVRGPNTSTIYGGYMGSNTSTCGYIIWLSQPIFTHLEPIYPPYMVDVLGPLTLAVIGILRIGVGIYGLELSRSTYKTQSDIYYRIYYFLCNNVGRASIAGKSRVSCKCKRDGRAFWWGGRVVSENGLTKPNYISTTCGGCIGTRG